MFAFLGADIRQQSLYLCVGHCEALIEVAQRGCELAVGTSELRDDDFRHTRVGILDIHGVLQFLFILPHILAPFPGPRVADPVPVLKVFVLLGSERTEFLVVLGNCVFAELLIFSEHRESAPAVGVSIEVEIQLFEREVVLFYSL